MLGFRNKEDAERMLNSIKTHSPKQQDLQALRIKQKEEGSGFFDWISKKIFQPRSNSQSSNAARQEVTFNRQPSKLPNSPSVSIERKPAKTSKQESKEPQKCKPAD